MISNLPTSFLNLCIVALLVLGACSDDQPELGNGPEGVDPDSDAMVEDEPDTSDPVSTDCIELQSQTAEAIRALPRGCSADSDCMVVPRAADCECDNAINASADLAPFEDLLGELDDAQCGHPFTCSQPMCPEPGASFEILAECQLREGEQTCGLRETFTCDAIEAGATGGLVNSGSCTDHEDCVLRNDLNPCGCDEGITNQFPLLSASAIAEEIEFNGSRCNFTCDACPEVAEARCVDNVCTEI